MKKNIPQKVVRKKMLLDIFCVMFLSLSREAVFLALDFEEETAICLLVGNYGPKVGKGIGRSRTAGQF